MSLDVGRYKLYSTWKAIDQRWEETQLTWHDVVRAEFAKEFWADMEYPVSATLAAVDRLSQVLVAMRQECGDR
ncbi:MAG: hypothetical protein HY040_02010 [Planctomycetes bacterium]|nr:hypothetical protein [Planctomycetota bacterium]